MCNFKNITSMRISQKKIEQPEVDKKINMELDSIWDEELFSMVSDELDYEFDENDLFKNPEDVLQGTIKNEDSIELSNFVQSDIDSNLTLHDQTVLVQAELEKKDLNNFGNFSLEKKFAFEDIASQIPFTNRREFVNVTPSSLGSSHEFTDKGNVVKTEIKRRNSIDSDIFNMDCQIVIDARIFLDSYNRKKEHVDAVPSSLGDKSKLNSTKKISHSTSYNQNQKLNYENHSLSNGKSSVAHNVTRKKPVNTVACNSSKKHVYNDTNISRKSHKPNSERMKLKDFVIPHADKKYQSKKEKNEKKRNYFPDSQNENLKLEDAKSTLKTNSTKLGRESSLKAKKFKAKDKITNLPNKNEFPPDRKNILTVKRENDHLANLKTEPSSNNYMLHPKLVLERLPSNTVQDISVRTKSDNIKLKDEILDQKPVLPLNVSHLPKARVVLKRLTEADLRSPATLLARVKTEMNENISRKLRSQGKARDKDFIHRYCCKCKSLQVERRGLSKKKICDYCGFHLIYLCIKCNKKHYVNYYHLYRHLKHCCGSGETKPCELESIFLHQCTECTFKTTHSQVMASHVKSKGHKADGEFDVDKVVKGPKVKREKKRTKREVSDKPKIPRTKYSNLIIKQNVTAVADVTERYCTKCRKPRASKTRKAKESCRSCNTLLHLRCLKCHLKFKSYDTMLQHLRSNCSPNSYKCAKCDYTDSTWSLMQQHAMEQHDKSSKSSQKVDRKKKRKEIFYCKLCSFQTNYEQNLKRHMKTVHKN